jgi:hypothetical protein
VSFSLQYGGDALANFCDVLLCPMATVELSFLDNIYNFAHLYGERLLRVVQHFIDSCAALFCNLGQPRPESLQGKGRVGKCFLLDEVLIRHIASLGFTLL